MEINYFEKLLILFFSLLIYRCACGICAYYFVGPTFSLGESLRGGVQSCLRDAHLNKRDSTEIV